MILQIKHFPSNNVIAETGEFTASESFMDIKNLAVKIESPTKLIFTPYNGGSYNYIDYNNNRYYLFIDPTTKDDNKSEKFTYNFDFKGFEYILKLIPFIDIIKSGGNITYTNGGIVSFFGGTDVIAQFLNANIEQYFGNNYTWQVTQDFGSSFDSLLYPDQYFNLINNNCWDAVLMIKDVLGLNFFIETPIDRMARIRITDKTDTLSHVFRQGDGNGLYSIGKTISNEEDLLTVIRPYGGNRNISPGYKKNSSPSDSSRYNPYLLLPDLGGFLRYEIRNENAISKYGVRTKSISDPFQGIFPSIQNATLGDVYGTPLPPMGNDDVSLVGLNASDRIDRIVASDFNAGSIFFTIYVTDIGFDLEKKDSADKYLYYTGVDSVISMRTGLYAGQDFVIQQGKVTKLIDTDVHYSQGARYSIVLERNEDGTDAEGNSFLVPTEALSANDKFAILGIYMPDVYDRIAENRLLLSANEYLKRFSVPQYTIPIDIAVSYFIENPDEFINFRAGNRLKVWGDDIDVDIESFTIQSYSLQYTKDNIYAKYSVTLSEVKEMGLTDRLNAVTNAASQTKSEQKYIGGGGGGGGGDLNVLAIADKRYIRKDRADIANGLIDFQKGINAHEKSNFYEGIVSKSVRSNDFAEGMTGFGHQVDQYGAAWFQSISIRGFLEVPEIRFNRVSVTVGHQWQTNGGGIIEEVTMLDDVSGLIRLRLEEGEYGAVAADDLNMGIWHNFDSVENDLATTDDGKGNFTFAGFGTCYFRVIEILETTHNSVFSFVLRGISDGYLKPSIPRVGMHFAQFGNITNKERQSSVYSTTTYVRALVNVNTWEYTWDNIAVQLYDCSNLSVFGKDMKGRSAYMRNLYMTGTIEQFEDKPLTMDLDFSLGSFMAPNETGIITAVVLDGYGRDVTGTMLNWAWTRESGDYASDLVWNIEHAGNTDTCEIAYVDLGVNADTNITTMFTVTANNEIKMATGNITL